MNGMESHRHRDSSDLPPEKTLYRTEAVVPYYGSGGLETARAVQEEPPVRYWQLLRRKKLVVLCLMLAGAISGVSYVVFYPPMYRAMAAIELVGFNESFMGMNQLDPQAGTGNYNATAANLQTQVHILSSPSLLSRVIERVNLELTPVSPAPAGFFGRLRNRLGLGTKEPVAAMREAVQEAAESLRPRSLGSSRLIQIRCDSTSPEVAAGFLNTLVSEYISQNSQARSSTAVRTTQWIEGQVEEVRNRLERADARLQEFLRKEGSAFVLDQATLNDSKLRQLQAELSAIQSDRITKQSRYELAKSSPTDSLPDILDDGTLRGLRERMTELRRERAQLTATLMPDHYKVRRVEAQIAELEQTMQQEKGNLVRRIQNDYKAALRREKLLSSAYASQAGVVAGQAGKAAQYAMLKREGETTRQIYNTLLQQLSQAAMISVVPASSVRVVDSAAPAKEPFKPKPFRDIALASLLFGALGFAVCILHERLRLKKLSKVVVSPGHAGELLKVPELGVVPTIELHPQKSWFSLRNRIAAVRALPNGKPRNGDPGSEDSELVTLAQKPTLLAESFRLTLTAILGAKAEGWRPVLVVTSPGPGDGKTMLSANLAVATAGSGRRVLLIDADVRKARLHEVFKVSEGLGLADLLRSGEPPEQIALHEFIRPTRVARLHLMPSGIAKADTVFQMFFSQRLSILLSRLRQKFDLILIDTAPALHFSDARLLGRLSDGIIVVVRAGVTSRDSAVATCRGFASDGTPVLGTILNDWDPEETDEQEYYYERSQKYYDTKE